MTTKYEIYCGTEAPYLIPDAAEELARELAAQAFPDGHSIRIEDGCWLSRETGRVIQEKTVVVTWLCSDADKLNGVAHQRVNRMAGAYKQQASQEAVLVTTQEVYSVLV